MKTTDTKSKNGNNATATLARINSQIEELNQQRIGLAEPLKTLHSDLQTEIMEIQKQIRDLDPSWKPASLRPRADDKILEILASHDSPMTVEQIIQAVGSVFSPWKIKNTLKKRSTGPRAVFAMVDGKYSVRAAV
ncbi:MAG: hypothetical protein WBW41_15425 [Verrucomicrobiia bacterium]